VTKRIDAKKIRSWMEDNLDRVLQYLYPDGKMENGEFVVGNIYGDSGKSLKVTVSGKNAGLWVDFADCNRGGDLISLWQERFEITDFVKTLKDISEYIGDYDYESEYKPRIKTQAEINRELEAAKNKENYMRRMFNRIWKGSKPIGESLLFPKYMRYRGIDPDNMKNLGSDVRFNGGVDVYFKGKIIGKSPCMIALSRDKDGKPQGIHFTYLNNNGEKAVFKKAEALSKKMLAVHKKAMIGTSVKLTNENNGCRTLAICEGLETGDAIIAAISNDGNEHSTTPVRATLSGRNISSFIPPEDTENLLVCIDKDVSETGIKMGMALKERLATERPEINVYITMPDNDIPHGKKGIDYADLNPDEIRDNIYESIDKLLEMGDPEASLDIT